MRHDSHILLQGAMLDSNGIQRDWWSLSAANQFKEVETYIHLYMCLYVRPAHSRSYETWLKCNDTRDMTHIEWYMRHDSYETWLIKYLLWESKKEALLRMSHVYLSHVSCLMSHVYLSHVSCLMSVWVTSFFFWEYIWFLRMTVWRCFISMLSLHMYTHTHT